MVSMSSPTGKNDDVNVFARFGAYFARILMDQAAFDIDVFQGHGRDGFVARAAQQREGDQGSVAQLDMGFCRHCCNRMANLADGWYRLFPHCSSNPRIIGGPIEIFRIRVCNT